MPKFTLISEHATGEKTTIEFHKELLSDVVQNMELFLRGTGFYFNGNLEIVTESVGQYQFDPNQKGLYDV